MNLVVLTGRLTKDPEVRYAGENAIARFNLAVNRDFVKDDSAPKADFINCVAFGKSAEFIEKYFRKGMKADIKGRIQTGSYDNKEGQKVYTTDVIIEKIEFGESKSASGNNAPANNSKGGNNDFMSIPEGIENDLPF